MTPSYTSSTSSGPHPSRSKKERGNIAAQACETCRARKQRCDEQRPKCGHCQRMKLECHYREVQPTKKDRTLVEILERLTSLEEKVDRITPSRLQRGFGPPQVASASQPAGLFPVRQSHGESSSVASLVYRYTPEAHRILMWPVVQEFLKRPHTASGQELQNLDVEEPAFLVRLQRESQHLPLDERLVNKPFVGLLMQETRKSGVPRVTFPDLDYNTMHELATSYFDTFNLIYPFLDRQNFISDTLTKVHSEGFDDDAESVIALLVFALGELAGQRIDGDPIDVSNRRHSGLRGGHSEKPPGIGLFNEARSRLGFVVADLELESVQIFLLSSIYYGACFRHVEFWRMIIAASTTCQSMITANVIDWASQRGDLVKRAYWHCRMVESALRLELDLPLTSILSIDDSVDLPALGGLFCEADHRSNEVTHFEKHYKAHLALHQLCTCLFDNANDSTNITIGSPSIGEHIHGTTAGSLIQLELQLDQWLRTLPPELRWPEGEPTVFPELDKFARRHFEPLDPSLTTSSNVHHLFTIDIDQEPEQYPYAYDIQVAFLRTRFYYTKCIVNRPFVYKALHFPDQVTPTDMHGIGNCLKACLKWPIMLPPTSQRKRLIPHLFCWTQAFFGNLVILHLSQHVSPLREVRKTLGDTFEADAAESVELMLDWIRDLTGRDPFADFYHHVLETLYSTEELFKTDRMEAD